MTRSLLLVVCLFSVSATGWAHHGAGLSFDTNNVWTTWGTVVSFSYINPHPAVEFTRTDENGNVEHWVGEMSNNVSRLARLGWTKGRAAAAMAPGTRVKLYLATAWSGGHIAYVSLVESEDGEPLVSARDDTYSETVDAVDLDGVPNGFQPELPSTSGN